MPLENVVLDEINALRPRIISIASDKGALIAWPGEDFSAIRDEFLLIRRTNIVESQLLGRNGNHLRLLNRFYFTVECRVPLSLSENGIDVEQRAQEIAGRVKFYFPAHSFITFLSGNDYVSNGISSREVETEDVNDFGSRVAETDDLSQIFYNVLVRASLEHIYYKLR